MGGVVGYTNYGKILTSYFAGIANHSGAATNERGIVGAVVNGTLTDNYFDSDVCASASSYCAATVLTGTTAWSTNVMQTKTSYPAGFDFITTWKEPGVAGYMLLVWEP